MALDPLRWSLRAFLCVSVNECLVCFRFKTLPDPFVRAVCQKGRRDRVHQEPLSHPQTHTRLVFEPRWTESSGVVASFESTSGSADSHSYKITTGKTLCGVSALLYVYFRYFPGIQVQVEVKFDC